jgi:DNA-binding NtrC family response regulator
MRSYSVIVGAKDDGIRRWLVSTLADMRAVAHEAFSGWEILRLLSVGERVDLVISDLDLPGPGCLRTLSLARTIGVDVPFLLVADPADFEVRIAAARLGAGLLGKPLTADDLARTIRKTARIARLRPPQTLH